jgi:CRP-like cAMP-binding protein
MIDVESLARLAFFSDLTRPQLEAVAATVDEQRFPRGTRILREHLSGSAFYVIVDGEASVHIDGEERARLSPGDFFGEISILTGDPPDADVVAASEELRAAVLSGPELEPLLLAYPKLAVRMLEIEARRLRRANRWQG